MPERILKQLRNAIECIQEAISVIEKQPDIGEPIGVCIRDKVAVYKPQRIVRGLCPKCYSLLRGRVDSGETTWEELEESGMAKPKGKSGRKKIDF